MSTSPSVRGAALWSMGAQYVVFAVQFAVSVVISRYFLTPAEVGLFSIGLSAAMMVSILQDFGLTRYIAGERELDDAKIHTCFSVSILFAGLISLTIFALAWPVAAFYGDVRLTPLMVVIAGSFLIVPFGIVPSALLQRALDFRSMAWVNIGAALANATVAIALAWAGWSAMALAWGLVAQNVARAILGQWRSRQHPRWPLSLAGVKPILRFGSGASILYVSGAIGTRAPELIIGRMISIAGVGLYGRASSLAGQLYMLVTGAIGGVFYPAFARIRDRGETLAPPYLRVVAGYSAVTWPAMAFLSVAAAPIVLLLYGETWAAVAPLLAWIALSELFFTALPLHMEIPIVMGRMRTLLWLNLIDTAVSIGLLVLAATYSLEWAAASRVGWGILWFAIYARFMRGLIGFEWRAMIAIYLKSGAAALATIAPFGWLVWQGTPAGEIGVITLTASALAGCVGWAAAIVVLRHPVRHELVGMVATLRESLPRAARA